MQEFEHELFKLGVPVKTRHNEVAPSQYETAPIFDLVSVATDRNQLTMEMLKQVAKRHNLTFLVHEKPFAGINGSGMHTHQSLWREGKNAFAEASDEYGLSGVAKQFIAGQLKHARAMSAIIAPLVNSYKRLVPGYEAPVYLSWSRTNRSSLVRVPRLSPNRTQAVRAELREETSEGPRFWQDSLRVDCELLETVQAGPLTPERVGQLADEYVRTGDARK